MTKKNSVVKSTGSSNRLPRWDLSQLYPALDSPEFSADLSRLGEMVDDFAWKYKGRVSSLTAEEMAAAISGYEKIDALTDRLDGYVLLLETDNMNIAAKTSRYWDKASDIKEKKSFLSDELGKIPEKEVLAKMSSPALSRYASWVARMRDDYDGRLQPGIKSLRDAYSTRSASMLERLYADTVSDFRTLSREGERNWAEAESFAVDFQTSLQARKKARQEMAEALKLRAPQLSFIFNALAKDNNIDARYAGFDRTENEHVAAASFDPAITAQMVKSMRKLYARISHRFFSWIAKTQGKDRIHVADLRKAPQDIRGNDPKIPFSRARDTVFSAAAAFSPKLAKPIREIFEQKRIDATSSARKNDSPFARQMGLSSGPFVSVIFQGVAAPMGTLAHELGHGAHMDLMRRQGLQLDAEVSNHISEIPSTFMELLTAEAFLEDEKHPLRRKRFMFDYVQDVIDTCMQQFSYFDFEIRLHKGRKSGPLSFEKISDIWTEVQREYYGPSVVLDEYERYTWATVPHFVSMPFYVSSYPFAMITAGSLFQQYKEAQAAGKEAAAVVADKYVDFLKSGATRSMQDTFRMLDIDPYKPDFWEKGVSFIEKRIDQLEKSEAPARRAGGRAVGK